MISRGYLRGVAKLNTVSNVLRYNYEVMSAKTDKGNALSADEKHAFNELITRVTPIREALDAYIKREKAKLSKRDLLTMYSKADTYNRVVSKHLGYLGQNLEIMHIINNKRKVKAYDLDIIALYMLDKLDFKSNIDLIEVARFISDSFNLNFREKMCDRFEHIAKVNSILMEMN